ncbi:hypothetical protein BEWA_030040 [Theileria equi strain WA]|uniref:Uncharacterized protein n=1 Tax=Theileria equi strain WA TaxID=1537102 RepID=L0AX36_THEEQ|nr:hypothetical protein BEWA_030040 [Theileria equi strain WA]AFZ80152.1 hypothetical protein BEWA_030040 [Theileria equi strain WA]|eukprot:XP_004829818.1 hypothetical protein BEWA_030040 [Theileria equi strain WA]
MFFNPFTPSRRWIRHWAKKKHIESTHYSIKDPESSLYRQVVPGDILANRKRLPNKKTSPREYRLGQTASGTYRLLQPYPPNVNVTLPPFPNNVAGIRDDPNKMGHVKFIQKYKGIEYITIKRMLPYPRGKQAYTFDVERVTKKRS